MSGKGMGLAEAVSGAGRCPAAFTAPASSSSCLPRPSITRLSRYGNVASLVSRNPDGFAAKFGQQRSASVGSVGWLSSEAPAAPAVDSACGRRRGPRRPRPGRRAALRATGPSRFQSLGWACGHSPPCAARLHPARVPGDASPARNSPPPSTSPGTARRWAWPRRGAASAATCPARSAAAASPPEWPTIPARSSTRTRRSTTAPAASSSPASPRLCSPSRGCRWEDSASARCLGAWSGSTHAAACSIRPGPLGAYCPGAGRRGSAPASLRACAAACSRASR